MAVFVAGPGGVDMSFLDLTVLWEGDVVARDSSLYRVDLGGGDIVSFTGTGFSYDSTGYPIGGTITGLSETVVDQTAYQLSGIAIPVATVTHWVENALNVEALATVFGGADTLTASDTPGAVLLGLDGDDVLTGGSVHNYLRGGAGADTIRGGAGYDDVNGNQGDDVIDGGAGGNDWLLGGQGNDQIAASSGDVIINGNLGADTVAGGAGADVVRGGQANDLMNGGGGNDQMYGDRGDDAIAGGGGADTFHFSAASGHDVITDFSAAQGDRVQLDPGAAAAQVSQSGANTVIDLVGGDQVILTNVDSSTLPAGWLIAV